MRRSPASEPNDPARPRTSDKAGDAILRGICLAAVFVVCLAMFDIAYQLIHGSNAAWSKYGLSFVTHESWKPNFNIFGAGSLLYGTLVSSLIALCIAAPVGIAIALYLALMAPRSVRTPIGSLVEMLAAVPSVIIGFWGIIVLSPFVRDHMEPFLHSTLGFIPLFGKPQTTGASMFTASLVLAIMIVPIIASVSRDLFSTVPRELQDGAAALGATRWEMVRGVILPTTASGVAAATCLALGRALGEAIAVTQVIGAGTSIHTSLFNTADTLSSRIAAQFPGATTTLHSSSLFYCATMLLVIGVSTNLLAQWISRRFDPNRLVTK